MNVERALLRVLVWPIHRLAIRISGGRVGSRGPAPDRLGTLILSTVGRRSGARRDTPVYFMPDGDRFVVVASNAGGQSHPAWWLNMQASGEAEIRTPTHSQRVRAHEATDFERERLWPQLVRRYPRYADYARRTERPIPIVILEPI